MATITESATQIGKFRRARDSAPPRVIADILAPGDARSGISKALAARTALGSNARGDRTGGRKADSGPGSAATSVDDLQAQVARMAEAFRESEGRDPTLADRNFSAAFAELVGSFAAALLADSK